MRLRSSPLSCFFASLKKIPPGVLRRLPFAVSSPPASSIRCVSCRSDSANESPRTSTISAIRCFGPSSDSFSVVAIVSGTCESDIVCADETLGDYQNRGRDRRVIWSLSRTRISLANCTRPSIQTERASSSWPRRSCRVAIRFAAVLRNRLSNFCSIRPRLSTFPCLPRARPVTPVLKPPPRPCHSA